jgi:hypothetical protein
VALHLLAERARASWPPKGPDAAELRKQVLVQRLLERELEPGIAEDSLPDAFLRSIYERAKQVFVHSRLVEVGVLNISVPHNAPADARAHARAAMADLAKTIAQRSKPTAADFIQLGAQTTWQQRRVQYTQITQSDTGPFSAKFGAAVFRLHAVGEVTGVIEDEGGLAIACYIGERPAINRPFEAVRQEMRTQAYPHWRQKKFVDFADAIAAQHEVQIHTSRLSPGS